MRSTKNAVRGILLCLIASICFLDYWEYNRQVTANGPEQYTTLIQGTGDAPQQYRVLIVRSAWFLAQHAHLKMRHAFVAFDFFSAVIAGFILLLLLERSEIFRRWKPMAQLCAYATYLFLTAYYLIWLDWYQRPETLPTLCFVTLMLALLSRKPAGSASLLAIVAGTLGLVLLQALTRADVAFCFYAGVFLYACLPTGRLLPGPRYFHAALAAVAAVTAAATQWVIAHRIYPNATYGDTAVLQIRGNLGPLSLIAFLLFLVPAGWTLWYVLKQRPAVEAPWLALLLGACIFIPLWATVGRVQEVRIFLPLAVALIPLTVACVTEALSVPHSQEVL